MSRSSSYLFIANLAAILIALTSSGCQKDQTENTKNSSENTNIHLKVELLQCSSIPTLEEIAPYEEALIVSEYRVVEVIDGQPPSSDTIRIAHWSMTNKKMLPVSTRKGELKSLWITPFDGIADLTSAYQRDDLDFDPDKILYYDLTPLPDTYTPSKNVRYDYRSDITRRLRIYWLLRHQLKLVVIGNSHTASAVNTRMFYQPGNDTIPVTLNLSPAGSGITFQSLLTEQYLTALPDLEWVIWGVSPRIFNNYFAVDRRLPDFLKSPGYLYDRQHWDELTALPAPSSPLNLSDILSHPNTNHHPWGWTRRPNREFSVPISSAEREKFMKKNNRSHFRWNSRAWDQFENSVKTLAERNIKVLLFTPPFHPLLTQTALTDIDGTGKRDYKKIIERLHDLSERYPNVYFIDIHQGGQHQLKHENFSDFDHLHTSGAKILTKTLVDFVEKINTPQSTQKTTTH